jgi:hypothetical protein
MEKEYSAYGRRNFLKNATALTAGISGLAFFPETGFARNNVPDEFPNVIGPRAGFTPQIGTLLSMMTWMRGPVTRSANGLSVKQLDFLLDKESNSIGSMLLHLAATERYYQLNTFENLQQVHRH